MQFKAVVVHLGAWNLDSKSINPWSDEFYETIRAFLEQKIAQCAITNCRSIKCTGTAALLQVDLETYGSQIWWKWVITGYRIAPGRRFNTKRYDFIIVTCATCSANEFSSSIFRSREKCMSMTEFHFGVRQADENLVHEMFADCYWKVGLNVIEETFLLS